MNYYIRLTLFTLASLSLTVTSCDENDDIGVAKPATSGSSTKTNFLFINALPEGVSLDLFANGIKGATADVGTGQNGYTPIDIQTGFAANGTNAIANTSIRAKATTGTIGGVLGSSDLLYRQTNTGFGNFTSSTNAFYTAIALDSLNRPLPRRTFSINSVTGALAADITYYNTADGSQISNDVFKALAAGDQARCISLGTIPAGTTDVGGPRFLILTDVFPTLSSIQAGIRFVNAVPNSYASLPNNRRVFARLRATAGSTTNLTLSSADYVMGGGVGAGSRTASTAFTPQAISNGTTAFTYTLEFATDAGFTSIIFSQPNLSFSVGKSYTIVARGILGKTDSKRVTAIVVTHN